MFSKFGVVRICRRFYSSTPSMNVGEKRLNAVTIDGNKIASQILGVTIRHEIDKLKQVGVTPRLVAVLVKYFSLPYDSDCYTPLKDAIILRYFG